jgi:hypothetical protein
MQPDYVSADEDQHGPGAGEVRDVGPGVPVDGPTAGWASSLGRAGVEVDDVEACSAASGSTVIRALPEAVPVDADGQPLPCAGRHRVGDGPKQPCPKKPIAEVIRSCHDTSVASVVCVSHLGHVLNGGSSDCATCGTPTVVLVGVLSIGGAF